MLSPGLIESLKLEHLGTKLGYLKHHSVDT